MFVSQQREKNKYVHLYAADETALWLDLSGGKCVERKRAKEVSVLTADHDKLHITVMLTARADGTKCKRYVLLPRKRVNKQIWIKIDAFLEGRKLDGR